MIEIQDLNFKYKNLDGGTVDDIHLSVKQGEIVLLCGKSGCGKTTVTRLINGLIPHYYEGSIGGTIMVDGMNVRKTELYKISQKVGSVFQNPRSQFFCVDTSGEIVFGCENEGLSRKDTLHRYLDTVHKFHIEDLMGRNIFMLSGGEKQKIACASVCAAGPDIIVLDEPTSNLDVDAIKELGEIIRLWKQEGKTVIIAEHRLYWLKDICDRVVYGSPLSRKDLRKKSYLVMQDVNYELFAESVEKECVLGIKYPDMELAAQTLEELELYAYRKKHPNTLSGGQKQRLAVAVSMMCGKEILIFDEPTSGLDYDNMVRVANIMGKLAEMGKLIFVVTHDYEFVCRSCSRILHLDDGREKEDLLVCEENMQQIQELFKVRGNSEGGDVAV